VFLVASQPVPHYLCPPLPVQLTCPVVPTTAPDALWCPSPHTATVSRCGCVSLRRRSAIFCMPAAMRGLRRAALRLCCAAPGCCVFGLRNRACCCTRLPRCCCVGFIAYFCDMGSAGTLCLRSASRAAASCGRDRFLYPFWVLLFTVCRTFCDSGYCRTGHVFFVHFRLPLRPPAGTASFVLDMVCHHYCAALAATVNSLDLLVRSGCLISSCVCPLMLFISVCLSFCRLRCGEWMSRSLHSPSPHAAPNVVGCGTPRFSRR